MKKFFSVILMCVLFVSILAFSGCGEIVLKGGPSKTDSVTGNGSLSVRKGNYLYFVNGFVSNSSLTNKDNNYGVAKNGAIYRVKLNNGELTYDVSIDEDGNEVKTLKDVELLVPKVAGFEYSDLHIFGDTLFFTSPNTEKDNSGKIRFDLTDVFAVNINGGKISKIVNALNITSADQIKYSYIDEKVYVTYSNNNKLYNVKVSGSKIESVNLISENVTSFGAYENSDTVYYTRSFIEGENTSYGNVLCKASLKDNKENVIFRDNENTFLIKKVTDQKIYYTRTNSLITNAYLYSLKLDDMNKDNEKQYTVVSYSENQYIYDLGLGFASGVIVSNNSKLLYVTGTNNIEKDITLLYDGSFTVFGIYGEDVYGKDADGNIVKINIENKSVLTLLEKNDNLKTDMSQNFDFENGYIYYYIKYTGDNSEEGYYLNRLNLKDKTTELVGELLNKHIVANK